MIHINDQIVCTYPGYETTLTANTNQAMILSALGREQTPTNKSNIIGKCQKYNL